MGRRGPALRLLAPAALLSLSVGSGVSCQGRGALSDTERQARIDALYESYKSEFPRVPETTVEALVRELDGPDPPVLNPR